MNAFSELRQTIAESDRRRAMGGRLRLLELATGATIPPELRQAASAADAADAAAMSMTERLRAQVVDAERERDGLLIELLAVEALLASTAAQVAGAHDCLTMERETGASHYTRAAWYEEMAELRQRAADAARRAARANGRLWAMLCGKPV